MKCENDARLSTGRREITFQKHRLVLVLQSMSGLALFGQLALSSFTLKFLVNIYLNTAKS